jgi:hypothetical protein
VMVWVPWRTPARRSCHCPGCARGRHPSAP